MYEPFYNLNTPAFRLTPDPKLCFAHASYNQARAYLEYALKLGEGFIVVTGRPGTGKTTLVEAFLHQLGTHRIAARRVVASNLEAADLLRAVAYAYGIGAEGLDTATLRLRIQQFFTQCAQTGRHGLLVIDEAQGLSRSALEELRLLSDLQTGVRPLLQLFLVGQESLRDLMRSPAMEQFQQRVIGTCRLDPLSLHDTRGYVEYRLRQAGWNGDPEFSGAAIVSIHECTQGVPRHINKTCTRLLLYGFMEAKHQLGAADVRAIAAELREEQLGPLESDTAVSSDAQTGRGESESETDSLSMAGLALRASHEQVQEGGSAVRQAAARARVKPAGQRLSRPRAAESRPIPHARPTRQSAHTRTAQLPLRHAITRRLRPYGLQILRQWIKPTAHSGLALRLGAVLVVTLTVAALITGEQDTTADKKAAFALYAELKEPQAASAEGSTGGAATERVAGQLEAQHRQLVAEASQALVKAQFQPIPAIETDPSNAVAAATQQSVTASRSTEAPLSPAAVPEQLHIPQPGPGPAAEAHSTTTQDVRQSPAAASSDTHASPPSSASDGIAPSQARAAQQDAADTTPPIQTGQSDKRRTTELAALTPPTPQIPPPNPVADAKNTPPQITQQQKIKQWLSQGRQALKEHRLLIPADNNAHNYYRQVLTLEPHNAEAREGIEKIVRRYTLFAERALERHDEEKTRQYIERGLRVRPGDPQLIALRTRMNSWLARLETEARMLPLPPPPLSAPAEPEPEGLLSRLKMFFSNAASKRRADSDPVE